ncbi:MAG: hypothetical protein NTV70_02285 [Acidobacteria bacterium]|nr:hypothetical protein [Acidobacteriota bacterium]
MPTALRATLRALYLFDVSDNIGLDQVWDKLRLTEGDHLSRSPESLGGAVRVRRPEGTVALYEFGVVSVAIEVPFSGTWEALAARTAELVDDSQLPAAARKLAESVVAGLQGMLQSPYDDWLTEDYAITRFEPGTPLLEQYGPLVAQLVRNESQPLSALEERAVLEGALSCYGSDLLVAGWASAVVCDAGEGAEISMQLIEYANCQLLEFRHYDAVLKQALREMAKSLGQRRWWRHWRIAREAARIHQMLLEVREITERSDNGLRLFGDMFYARAHRVIASRIGVDDFRRIVEGEMATMREQYQFLMDESSSQRAFLLEAAVVAILVIELVMLLAERK